MPTRIKIILMLDVLAALFVARARWRGCCAHEFPGCVVRTPSEAVSCIPSTDSHPDQT